MVSAGIRQFVDLVIVILVSVLVCGAVVVFPSRGAPTSTVVALSLALFLPGYALVAALFPESGHPTDGEGRNGVGVELRPDTGIDTVERMIFSFVVSVLVTPLFGLLLDVTPYGLDRVSVAISLAGVTVLAGIVGIARRLAVPPEERFSVWPHLVTFRARTSSASKSTLAANGLIIVSLLIATSGAMYATETAEKGETFTEFYLLSADDDGALVNEVPQQFVSGQTETIHVGVENHEHTTVRYSVIIRLERVDPGSGVVTAVETLNRYETTGEHGERSLKELQIRPTMEGENLRLSVLLYRGSPASELSGESAYRHTYAWVNVTNGSTSEG